MKVTVLVITYNHSRFIRQALDSILAQQTDFDFEVLISEDCSTDGTREIVLEYARAHRDKIHLLLSDVNVRSPWVIERGLVAAQGEYIALLDGDDYWISPYKLQEQARFMDAHPEYSLCFHYQEYVDADDKRTSYQEAHSTKSVWSLEDILKGCPIGTSSAMLRRSVLPLLPGWYRQCPFGDFPIWVLCMQKGPGGYLDKALGAYRVHLNGYYSGLDDLKQSLLFLRTYSLVYRHLAPQHQAHVAKSFARQLESLAVRQRSSGDWAGSRKTAREGLVDFPQDGRLWLLAHAPLLYASVPLLRRVWRRLCGREIQSES